MGRKLTKDERILVGCALDDYVENMGAHQPKRTWQATRRKVNKICEALELPQSEWDADEWPGEDPSNEW